MSLFLNYLYIYDDKDGYDDDNDANDDGNDDDNDDV
jgi:hypothetical protein